MKRVAHKSSRSTRSAALLLALTAACSSPAPSGREAPRSPAVPPGGSPAAPATRQPSAGLELMPMPSPAVTAIPPLDDAGEVADEILKAEQRIRSESTPDSAYKVLGRIQQAAYRKLVANPGFRQAALDAAPANLRPVLEANIRAGEQLSSLTRPVTKLPAWKIVQPPPAVELKNFYSAAESEFGIPWQYLAAIHLVESRMGRIRGTSSAGAQGPMQFLPSTWAAYGRGDINDPRDAILAAGRYLKAAGAPANMGKALYAYNHSQKYVDAVTAYAQQMMRSERTFLAYYEWQVYVKTTTGDVLLEVGYGG